MNLFEEEYKKSLVEINKLLETTTDITLKKQLLNDKEVILNRLYPNQMTSNFKYISKVSKEEIKKMILSTQLDIMSIKNIKKPHKKDIYLFELFKQFINNNKLNIKNTYKKITNYNGIKYISSNNFYYGATIYIPSLKKNFIKVCNTKNIYKYSVLVHELGHAKINFIENKINLNRQKSSLEESYPIFLELVFSDYIKDKGFLEESFQIKYLIYNQIKQCIKELNDEVFDYLHYDENRYVDRFIFDNKYELLKNLLLGLQLYYMYLNNPDLTLIKLENFVNNIYKVSDNELLKMLEINEILFNDKNVSKFYIELKSQKIKIK